MVWTTRNSPQPMKQLPDRIRRKALDIANALLAQGYQDRRATYIAVSMAREWAEHGRGLRERNVHVLPHDSGWSVCRAGDLQTQCLFLDKGCALSFAVELARAEGVVVIAHDESGAVEGHIHLRPQVAAAVR